MIFLEVRLDLGSYEAVAMFAAYAGCCLGYVTYVVHISGELVSNLSMTKKNQKCQ